MGFCAANNHIFILINCISVQFSWIWVCFSYFIDCKHFNWPHGHRQYDWIFSMHKKVDLTFGTWAKCGSISFNLKKRGFIFDFCQNYDNSFNKRELRLSSLCMLSSKTKNIRDVITTICWIGIYCQFLFVLIM